MNIETIAKLIAEIKTKADDLESALEELDDDVSPPSVEFHDGAIVMRQGADSIFLFRRSQADSLVAQLTRILSEIPRDTEDWE